MSVKVAYFPLQIMPHYGSDEIKGSDPLSLPNPVEAPAIICADWKPLTACHKWLQLVLHDVI